MYQRSKISITCVWVCLTEKRPCPRSEYVEESDSALLAGFLQKLQIGFLYWIMQTDAVYVGSRSMQAQVAATGGATRLRNSTD